MQRSVEQLHREAWKRLQSIRENGEEPSECYFLVTPYERSLLLDRAPFHRPEMNLERTTFFGMRIALKRGAAS